MLRTLFKFSLPLRGAKKGKGKGEEVKIEATTDIINIYKDKTDPERLPASEYPPWLLPMVTEFDEHPIRMVERMYYNKEQNFTYHQYKRLWKWSKRSRIIIKNKTALKPYREMEKHFKKFDITIPGADDSDNDPDDRLGTLMPLALGAPPKAIIDECLEKIRIELGIIKEETS